MLFSFVKELNEETTEMLNTLRDRGTHWKPSSNVVVWVFHVGEDREGARARLIGEATVGLAVGCFWK